MDIKIRPWRLSKPRFTTKPREGISEYSSCISTSKVSQGIFILSVCLSFFLSFAQPLSFLVISKFVRVSCRAAGTTLCELAVYNNWNAAGMGEMSKARIVQMVHPHNQFAIDKSQTHKRNAG